MVTVYFSVISVNFNAALEVKSQMFLSLASLSVEDAAMDLMLRGR